MPRPRLRTLRLLFAAGLIAGTASIAGPVRAAEAPDTTKMEFTAFRAGGLPIVPGQDFTLKVRIWTGVGPLDSIVEMVSGTPTVLGSPSFNPDGSVNGDPAFGATLTVADPSNGHHDYQAIFAADATYDAVTLELGVDVDPVDMTVSVSADVNPVQRNHAVTLTAAIDGPGTGQPITGDVLWRDTDSNALLPDGDASDLTVTFTPSAAGTRHIRAEYAGDETHAPANSAPYTLTVTNDSVQASGVTIDLATFYPFKDGYRDVVRAKGTRIEPASVKVTIYNASNRVVRTISIARAAGAYSIPWNGRSNGGTLQVAGRYKIVQLLTDAAGTKLTVSKFVTLSRKKLVYSTKYVTKNGSSITAAGTLGNGSIAVSKSTGVARLRASYGSWAGAGYQFSLPSATVYKSIAFQVYVKSPLATVQNYIGIQNFKTCSVGAGWDETCFDHWRSIGSSSSSPVWMTSSGSANNNRSGRTARGMISVYYGTAYVYKARIKVVVGVLK